jgi:hypothetical protein
MWMTRSFRPWVLAALVAVLISAVPVSSDADPVSGILAAAPSGKQQCTNTCRARYRDCRRFNQLPAFQCRNVYQDCTRYACTGLGPG